MHHVSSTLDDAPATSKPSSGLLSFAGKNAPALADPALIAGCNFISMALAIRAMSPISFGQFALAITAIQLLNTIQSALITQPHGVLGTARLGTDTYLRYTGSLAGMQAALVIVSALIALASAGVAEMVTSNNSLPSLLLAMTAVILAWQPQEFARRVLYTEHRFGAALFNDSLSYGGQVLLLWGLHRRGAMTPTTAMLAIASAFGLAAVVGAIQIRRSLRPTIDRSDVRDTWHFGKWLVGAEVLNWFSSFAMFQYATAYFLGAAASASLKVAQVVFGPARIIAQFLFNTLPLRFSRTLTQAGPTAMHAQLNRVMRVIVPLSAAYCIPIAIFAEPLLRMLNGGGNKYEADWHVLSLYAAAALAGNMLQVLGAALKARQLTRQVFVAFAIAGACAVPAAVIGILLAKVVGAVLAMIATDIVLMWLFWRLCVQTLPTAAKSSDTPEIGEVTSEFP